MAERFYVNSPLAPGTIVLEGPEAHHLAVVSRVRAGDRVYLFNGDGRQYPALVNAALRKHVELTVDGVEAPERERMSPLEVAVPLPKADRAAFLVEKLTELGVTSLVPLRTARSVVHPRETRLVKLERTVVEASKQCGRNVLMRIEPLTEWQDYCRRAELPSDRSFAHIGRNTTAMDHTLSAPASGRVVAIGPEGGFTDEEAILASRAGWRIIGLGPRVLRVETAAILLAALTLGPELAGGIHSHAWSDLP
jgi:16S rRNA (uracil1498-N3)-methyltransferase